MIPPVNQCLWKINLSRLEKNRPLRSLRLPHPPRPPIFHFIAVSRARHLLAVVENGTFFSERIST
jgi:hypothetical protein